MVVGSEHELFNIGQHHHEFLLHDRRAIRLSAALYVHPLMLRQLNLHCVVHILFIEDSFDSNDNFITLFRIDRITLMNDLQTSYMSKR